MVIELEELKINEGLNNMASKISIPIFLLCLILFFTPFIKFDCGGQKLFELSGINLVVGKEIETASFFGKKEVSKIKPEVYAILSFTLLLIGLVLNLLPINLRDKISVGLSLMIILFMILLKFKIDGDVSKASGGMVNAKFTISYWLIIVFNLFIILINIFLPKNLFSKPLLNDSIKEENVIKP
jgi:hypothetical protein